MQLGSPMAWMLFIGVVILLLGLDLLVFQRRAHAVSVRQALVWSGVWIGLSLAFNAFIPRQLAG